MSNALGTGQALLPTYAVLAASLCLNALANFTIKLAVQGRRGAPCGSIQPTWRRL